MSKLMKTALIAFDIFIFVVICYVGRAIHRRLTPFKRGFFCDDESLQYPYYEQTVSSRKLFLTGFTVPSLLILAVELFKRAPYTETVTAAATGVKINEYRLGFRLWKCCAQLGIFIFGFIIILFTVELVKAGSGRLRPHFFAVCQPQFANGSTCDDPINFGRYIEEYTCSSRSSTKVMLTEAVKSFPSGHAATSFYSMLYSSIYLHVLLSTHYSKLLKYLLQFIFMLVALYVALTRFSDNMHHLSDVIAGILFGSCNAVCMALFVADVIGDSETTKHVKRRRRHRNHHQRYRLRQQQNIL